MTQTVNIASLATQIGDDVRKLKVIDSGTFAEMLPAPITITIWFLPDGDYKGIWARHPVRSWEYQGRVEKNDEVSIWNAPDAENYPDAKVVYDVDSQKLYRRGMRKLVRLPDAADFHERQFARPHGPGFYVYQVDVDRYFVSDGDSTWIGAGINEPNTTTYPEIALDPTVQPSTATAGQWSAIETREDVRLEDFKPLAGITGDDTEAFNMARDAAIKHRLPLKLLGKTYNFYQPIVFDSQSFRVEGIGPCSRFDASGLSEGTVLKSYITTGIGFSFIGTSATIKNMTFAGITSDQLVRTELILMTEMADISIISNNAAIALHIIYSFTNTLKSIDLWNANKDRVGLGVYHDCSNPAGGFGGNVLFENVTTSYYDVGIELGAEDLTFASQLHPRSWARNNTFINCQGRIHNRAGFRIGAGYGKTTFINPWCEGGLFSDIHIHSGGGSVKIIGGTLGSVTNNVYGVLIGNPDTNISDEVPSVSIENAYIRCVDSGIRIFPPSTIVYPHAYHEFDNIAFTNNGGPPIKSQRMAQIPVHMKRPIKDNYNNGQTQPFGLDEAGLAYDDYIVYS